MTINPIKYANIELLNKTDIDTLIVNPIDKPIKTLYIGALFTGVNLNNVVKKRITALVWLKSILRVVISANTITNEFSKLPFTKKKA